MIRRISCAFPLVLVAAVTWLLAPVASAAAMQPTTGT